MTSRIDIRDRFQFEYTTITRIRAEGLASGSLSDADTRLLIREMSKVINNVTGQWFWPIESKERLSGRGFPVVSHPSAIPILEVRSLQLDSGTSGYSPYQVTEYVVDKRDLEVIGYGVENVAGFSIGTRRARFPKTRPLNIVADGTWGWLEDRPFVSDPFDNVMKVVTTTSATLANGATSVSVADSSGFRVGDVIILRSGEASVTYAGHAILTAVSSGTLTFDAINLNVASLASGATVITYGQIPKAIERACALLVVRFQAKFNSQASADASIATRIIRERTDNYEYQLSFDPTSSSVTSVTSGDIEVDRLLTPYHSPPYVGAV